MNTRADTAVQIDRDQGVDAEISACLSLAEPKSFFLFAGAGSGKTRSLVSALENIQRTSGELLRVKGQRVGVITYTNAASDEIKRRIQFDPLIDVRTIHSFAWSLIEGLDRDIREWLEIKLIADIEEYRRKEATGRRGKASDERKMKIETATRRLEALPGIKRFIYSPTGANRTRDALNHAEVIQLTAHFLQTKPRMQGIFVGRYPILLVDESQDTNRHLIDAFFEVEGRFRGRFSLGLIGDMMQRIYADGKEGLGDELPPEWATPGKRTNHRCPRRVIDLINKVRGVVDAHQQEPGPLATDGHVRFFLISNDHAEKPLAEQAIASYMAQLTGDADWEQPSAVKTLTLEHRMAASRMGFLDIFVPLYQLDSTGLLNGTLTIANFFTHQVLPLVEAKRKDDRFALMRVLKQHSPLLSSDSLRAAGGRGHLTAVQASVDEFFGLWDGGADPSLIEVLRRVAQNKLLEVPEALAAWANEELAEAVVSEQEELDERQTNISSLLDAPFSQVEPLREYLAGRARFDTHQGVKGLEFERVMVVMDDSEARGFLFKYEDLFGGKTEGKTLEATRRLFYVIASRAKQSLALVAYSAEPQRIRAFLLANEWFTEDEIIEGVPAVPA